MKKKQKISILFIWLVLVFSLFSCATSATLRESLAFEYFTLAEEYYELKKWDKALEFYTKSSQSENVYTNSLYKIGLIFVEQKKFDEAEKVFDEILDADKNNATLLSHLAFSKSKQKKFAEAILLYEDILLMYPMDQTTKKNLALVYWYNGDTEKARSIQKELIDENPLDTSLKDLLKEDEGNKAG